MDIYIYIYIFSNKRQDSGKYSESYALSKAKLTHMPKTTRRYNKRKDKKEKWMTNELLVQINKKNDMYVDWKTKSTTIEMYNNKKINFKTFEKIVNINIIETKISYYHNTF